MDSDQLASWKPAYLKYTVFKTGLRKVMVNIIILNVFSFVSKQNMATFSRPRKCSA